MHLYKKKFNSIFNKCYSKVHTTNSNFCFVNNIRILRISGIDRGRTAASTYGNNEKLFDSIETSQAIN